MTKADFVKNVADATSLTKAQAEKVVSATFVAMSDSLQNDGRFSYPGFGTLEIRERKERTGLNPSTREKITIPASRTVGFRPAKALKELIN